MKHKIYAVIAGILSTLMVVNSFVIVSAATDNKVVIDEFKNLDLVNSSSNVEVECTTYAKYGDTSRLNRPSKNAGSVTYNFEGLKSFEVTAYETINTAGHIIFEVSGNGENWTEVMAEKTVKKDSAWNNVFYRCSSVPTETKYLKITMKKPEPRNISAWETQLGRVKFEFVEGGGLLTSNKADFNGLNAVMSQNFDEIPSDWIIAAEHKDYISIEEKDGNSCLVLATEPQTTENKGCTNPEIKITRTGMAERFYRLTFKMGVNNAAFDRNVIIATDNDGSIGTYLYPISFGTNGNIGYRNSSFEFADFDEPFPYEVDKIYEISVIIDTLNATELVYIDGVRIEGEYSLNTVADGGISEIKISNMDANNVSGKTYIDSIMCETKGNMQSVLVGNVVFAHMNEHWARDYAEALVYQGVADNTDNFSPESAIEAGEFFGWILKGIDKEPGTDALLTAKAENIPGADEFSAVSDNVSRQQMVYVTEKVFNTELASDIYNSVYSDRGSIAEKYIQSVNNALGVGLISGNAQTVFRPLENATKAEAAATVARAICPDMRFNAGYVIGIYANSEWTAAANMLSDKLNNSFDVRILGSNDIIDGNIMNPDVMACLILMNDIDITEKGIKVLRSYLENGGDIVSCGPDIANVYNNAEVKIPMFEGYEWEPYMYDDAVKIATAENQTDFSGEYMLEGKFTGTTAVGFTTPAQSEYIPLLETFNKFGKSVGYAAGVLVEYDGMYKGGSWLFYGVDQPEFYMTDTFINSVDDTLKTFSSGVLFETYNRESIIAKNRKALAEFEITEPRPEGYVRPSDDGSHFIDAHGNDMFVVGANTFGPAEFVLSSGSVNEGTFDIERIENWFRLASEAGINVFRYWWPPTDPQAAKVLINYARKYNVYLYFVNEGHVGYKPNLEYLDKVSSVYGDEPMVLGYDLFNEPGVDSMLVYSGDSDDHPLIKIEEKLGYKLIDSPELDDNQSTIDYLTASTTWNYYNDAYNQGLISNDLRIAFAAAETFIRKDMFKGDLYSNDMVDNEFNEDCPQWFVDLVEEVVKMTIDSQTAAIRKNAPHALITVGYFTFIAMWPGASEFDWWNHHAYNRPNSYESVMNQLAIYDKQYEMNPNIPSVMGEFGSSGGHFLENGEHVKYDTTAGYEFLHYLYPFAKGYGGGVVWDLVTWNPVNYRYYDTSYHGDAGWNYEQDMYRERHGSFIWDGNPETSYKIRPIGVVTKEFEKFRNSHSIGDAELDIFEHDTQLKLGYTFSADNTFYVCANNYKNDRLEYAMPDDKQPIVLVDWSDGNIRITATRDMTLKIKPQGFVPDIAVCRANVSGNIHSYKVDGAYMVLELAECEEITISKGEDKKICVKVDE